MKVVQHRMRLLEARFPFVPVISKLEVVGRERGGEQLEDGKRHAAGVDTFEYQADSLLRSLPLELDNGYLVLLKALDHIALEFVEEPHPVGVEVPVLAVGLPPLCAVENTIHGKEIGSVFALWM